MTNALMSSQVVSHTARRVSKAGPFVGVAARFGVLGLALVPAVAASAAPIELKLSFFFSEKSDTFRYGVKPFVDAINAEGKGLITIKVYPDGALGKAVAEQPGLVLDGTADIAWVVPGQTPYRFPDNQALDMPGLFRDVREGTLVYTNLVAAKALRGYEDFFVIGAYTGDPKSSTAANQPHRSPISKVRKCEPTTRWRRRPSLASALSHRHAGVAAGQRAGARCHRCDRHEPGRFASVRHGALGGQPLSPRLGRRSALAGHEPQEIRQPAGSGAGAHPQIQR